VTKRFIVRVAFEDVPLSMSSFFALEIHITKKRGKILHIGEEWLLLHCVVLQGTAKFFGHVKRTYA